MIFRKGAGILLRFKEDKQNVSTGGSPHFGFENDSGHNGGVILAHDPKTKKLLWRIQIYKTNYDQKLTAEPQNMPDSLIQKE
jgi:hypothetical protein